MMLVGCSNKIFSPKLSLSRTSPQQSKQTIYSNRFTPRSASSASINSSRTLQLIECTGVIVLFVACSPSEALEFLPEPSNALSLPTWAIHVSSVVEWVTAMGLVWQYAEATGNERWKGLTWGMLPSLGSAMCACTWHFFYNAPSLEFLVTLQAFLTIVGNATCWIAAYRIYAAAKNKDQTPA
ncbi:hypothetical protein CEUSTIGMA_g3688.t1 [Chlamydomonas eustigma]|uniref:Ycf49-like protein n=1 Tax=Chlamydomonas eustigma TaxID=1157962 RepID=A0A250WZG8_9CHLO|nr:hypothetical protein CEUSTIGMA_g3688.t1 [Chlamydomonas eustigma]|eukprot:GAX76244.1 hypothetical protein CEUSTIGMA_g3688.t1 [Chlamydomonas eustigma]